MAQPGDVLAERWRLAEKIDAGAMGEIFRGFHHLLGHTVAIKVMMPEIARDTVAIERFLREARIAAKLQHRHVVRVEDYGLSADGQPFLVMELLHGESLARRLARTPRLPPREALAIVRQIAAALDAAHAAGIIHRDLKPENVFLVDDPEGGAATVKVLDFGVAKFTDALAAGGGATTSNTLVGTPRYMSPEQARSSRELDGRSDLWALGMLTYEMLTGRHPFDGEAIAELLVAILTHKIPPPSSVAPDLPAAMDAWVARAVARNKADRFATARSMCNALEQALDGNLGDWAPRDHGEDYLRPRRTTLKTKRNSDTPAPHQSPSQSPSQGLSPDGPAIPHVDETGRMAVAVADRTSQSSGAHLRASRNRTTLLASAVAVMAGLGLATVARFAPQGRPLPQPRAALARLPVPVVSPPGLRGEPGPPVGLSAVTAPVTTLPAPNNGLPTVERPLTVIAVAAAPPRATRHRGHHDGRHVGRTHTVGREYDPPGI